MARKKTTSADAIRLARDGAAYRGAEVIGFWESDWIGGKPAFKGRLYGEIVWSTWMKKHELRAWFAQG